MPLSFDLGVTSKLERVTESLERVSENLGVASRLEKVNEHVQSLKSRTEDCKMCKGTGRSGILGAQGLGLYSRPCMFCTRDEAPDSHREAPDSERPPARQGFAPPTASIRAAIPPANSSGIGRGLCCGYERQEASPQIIEKSPGADEALPYLPSYVSGASWESSCFIPMPRSNIEPSPLADEMLLIVDGGDRPRPIATDSLTGPGFNIPSAAAQAAAAAPSKDGLASTLDRFGEDKVYTGDGEKPQYEGQYEDGASHGFGCEMWPDGALYEGQFQRGVKHGTGKFRWQNGSVYEGDFINGAMSGIGCIKWSDGSEYEGQWNNNMMHGRGLFRWKDGRRYDGEYANDLKEGRGIYSWTDGKKYDGEWLRGHQHGNGTYINARGDRRNGIWSHGKLERYT